MMRINQNSIEIDRFDVTLALYRNCFIYFDIREKIFGSESRLFKKGSLNYNLRKKYNYYSLQKSINAQNQIKNGK